MNNEREAISKKLKFEVLKRSNSKEMIEFVEEKLQDFPLDFPKIPC